MDRQWRQVGYNNKRRVEPTIRAHNIFDQFVQCHATNRMVPKFVGEKGSAMSIYASLSLGNRVTKQPVQSTWVKNLHMHDAKKISDEELYRMKEILEDHEISNEILL